MNTIEQAQTNLTEQFADLDDWMDRYAMIIDLGNELPPMPENLKTPDRLIEGCQSRVWLNAEEKDGHCRPTPMPLSSKESSLCSSMFSPATHPRKYWPPTSISYTTSAWTSTCRRRVATVCLPCSAKSAHTPPHMPHSRQNSHQHTSEGTCKLTGIKQVII